LVASGTSTQPLRGRAAIESLRRTGRRSRCGPLTLIELPGGPTDPVRVGYRIGRHVGGAVIRNRVRRRLRAIVADVAPPPGTYLLSATPAAAEASFVELDAAVRGLVGGAHGSASTTAGSGS
jgi:ribonuclease P protein component